MSSYLLLYDISTSLTVLPYQTTANYIGSLISCWGGVASDIICNIMIANVLFIIIKRKSSLDLKHFSVIVNTFACLPSIIVDAIFITGIFMSDNFITISIDLYFYLRFSSIIFNFVCYGYCTYRMHQMDMFRNSPARSSNADKAITELVRRLKYYPLVQVVSRLGASWFIFDYGYDQNPLDNTDTRMFASQVMYALMTVAGAVGFLAIFLYM